MSETIVEFKKVKVSLAKALKIKNRIVERLKEQMALVQKYNTQVVKDQATPMLNSIPNMVNEALDNYKLLKNLLIRIKLVIATANSKILEDIVSLTEAKSTIADIRQIPVGAGTTTRGFSNDIMTQLSVIKEEAIQELVRSIEKSVDKFQENIDRYNATTDVEIFIDGTLITV